MKTVSLIISMSVTVWAFGIQQAAAGNPQYALVYNGDGACREECATSAAKVAEKAGYRVRFINSGNWNEALFQDAEVWIQPGGQSHVVAQALSHEQKQRLRDFIASGGGYVGFCAGGFFASIGVHDDKQTPAIEMLGILPVETDLYSTNVEAGIFRLNWFGKAKFLYWEGGPEFLPPFKSNIETVALYPDGKVASLRTIYGKGKVYVTGLHPEAPQFWRDYYKLVDPDGLDLDLAVEMVHWVAP